MSEQTKQGKDGAVVVKDKREYAERIYVLQAALCQALAHPVRLKILDALGESAVSNSELVAAIGVPKANVSQHIAVLKEAGIVAVERDGVKNVIRLQTPEVREACALVRAMMARNLEKEMGELSQLRQSLARGREEAPENEALEGGV
jgi:DNA-binding transcriptional ArsR family regulator